MTLDDIDKIGLIRESYRMDGITAVECRSIFVDWAIRLPAELAAPKAISLLLETYATSAPDHPMSTVLREGLQQPAAPKRRGGRNARVKPE